MKSTPVELIFTFRKKISFSSSWMLVLLSVCVIALIVYYLSIDMSDQPFFEGLIQASGFVLAVFISLVFNRRKESLKKLNPANPSSSIEDYEKYLNSEKEYFMGATLGRLILGAFMVIALLLLLFYEPHHNITGIVFGGFIGSILLSMIKGWMLMRDGMMLQDIKHSQKDQTSEIS